MSRALYRTENAINTGNDDFSQLDVNILSNLFAEYFLFFLVFVSPTRRCCFGNGRASGSSLVQSIAIPGKKRTNITGIIKETLTPRENDTRISF